MYIDVEPNPNTDKSFSMIYRDVTPPREVFAIKYTLPGGTEEPVQVTGWDADTGSPCPAFACKVEESGDGTALLIHGGSGGIRLKRLEDETPWNPGAPEQWGDSHLVLPKDSFIVYKDEL